MLSIGDFARLGQVSVRMLRHYDGIGLLRPARVDAATGYRRYAVDQIARLNRITPCTTWASPSTRSPPSSTTTWRSRSCAGCCGCAGLSWPPSSSRPGLG